LAVAGIRRRIGFAKGRGDWLLSRAVKIDPITHHIFHYCQLVKALGFFCIDFRMAFPIRPEETAAAEDLLPPASDREKLIALAPGGAANVKETMESRRWSPQNFGKLARLLHGQGYSIMLVGGPGDRAAAAIVREACPVALDLTGRTTLGEAGALLQAARAVVVNDCGLMHLAAAVGTPVIALFGPTHPEEKRPLSVGSIALWPGEKLECAPCYHDGDFPVCNDRRCLGRITPKQVLAAVEKALAESD
jgi:heptosyltransferase I